MASTSLHVLLFPFMAKGHTIPILQLARLLLRRNATVTLFTTPANRPFVATSLVDTPTTIVTLPFPNNIPGVPSGVESVDKLPSLSLFYSFVSSTKHMKSDFEQAIQSLKTPVTFMVTDGFFDWTLDSANVFDIPRLVYYGMSNFAMTMSRVIYLNPHLFDGKTDTEFVTVPEFPWIAASKLEFEDAFTDRDRDLNNPLSKWVVEQIDATTKSYGLVTNSFFELEPAYADYWNSKLGPKSWCVGPLCLAQGPIKKESLSVDKKQQIEEIKVGLERSEVSFLWVVRRSEDSFEMDDGFEERVKEKGIVVREWVNQKEILEHDSVKGFMSHCGWNSVLESICAAVPIIAWPLAAEQPLNAKFVVEEMKIGVRVESCDGSVKGFVKWEGLEKTVKELMEGVKGKEVRKKVKEISDTAIKAVEDGGSSWRALNELIVEL
ncbi:hypothetical protein M8C21_006574, partial [Ambrosia artemisiifolia]